MLLGTRNSEFDDAVPKLHARRSGMIFIPGATFQMGSDKHYPEEAPAHRVTVDGFWMDATPVTNAQFRAFVESTGYRRNHSGRERLHRVVDPLIEH